MLEMVGDTAKLVFEDMIDEVHRCNVEHGWFNQSRSVGDEMALLHSEVSEALEDFRRGHMITQYRYHGGLGEYFTDAPENEEMSPGKPVGFPSEMADILIRLFDTCKRHDIDLVEEFRIKMRYNWTRPQLHGGKAI